MAYPQLLAGWLLLLAVLHTASEQEPAGRMICANRKAQETAHSMHPPVSEGWGAGMEKGRQCGFRYSGLTMPSSTSSAAASACMGQAARTANVNLACTACH